MAGPLESRRIFRIGRNLSESVSYIRKTKWSDTEAIKIIMKNNIIELGKNHWLLKRVSFCWLCTSVDLKSVMTMPGNMPSNCMSFDLDFIPSFIQDHWFFEIDTAILYQ